MASKFRYDNKEQVKLPNPMSMDKSVVRTSIIPSLINVYEYNKARNINDILLYEIAKTYDKDYNEDMKVSILMEGNYIINNWNNTKIKCDFYTIKGIVENLLKYLGFNNRYTFEKDSIPDMHPGISAVIKVDREPIGIIGRVHPSLKKDDIYVSELSLTKLYEKQVKPIKFKEASKYPDIKRDLAFLVKKDMTAENIINQIKKSGGRLLSDVEVFDVYEGEKIKDDLKSIALSLTFSDTTKTLSDEEVTKVFENIISDVETKLNAKVRNGE